MTATMASIPPRGASVSLASSIASLGARERTRVLGLLTDREAQALLYDWRFWARASQLAPSGEWTTWLILAGRGFGKTRAGVEWVRGLVEGPTPLAAPAGAARRIAVIAETAADARDVLVEGESGFLAAAPPWCRPLFEVSKRRLTWPNGAIATLYNATEPDQLRGPQHDAAWSDELAKWRYAQATWDNLQLGLRLGDRPRQVVTTTPRPIPTLRQILSEPDTVVTRGTTLDNLAHLAPAFIDRVLRKYAGTRLGRQELDGEILDDVAGALWTRAMIEAARVSAAPELARIVVAVDPAVSAGKESDETGIVVAARGIDGHAYVLADRSCRLGPDGWARRAVIAYHDHKADRLVAEVNQGGELVERMLRLIDPAVAYRAVHAARAKSARAEPIAALYEQGRVHHVGAFPALEDQMAAFVAEGGEGSPDRVDALVWALTELMLGEPSNPRMRRVG